MRWASIPGVARRRPENGEMAGVKRVPTVVMLDSDFRCSTAVGWTTVQRRTPTATHSSDLATALDEVLTAKPVTVNRASRRCLVGRRSNQFRKRSPSVEMCRASSESLPGLPSRRPGRVTLTSYDDAVQRGRDPRSDQRHRMPPGKPTLATSFLQRPPQRPRPARHPHDLVGTGLEAGRQHLPNRWNGRKDGVTASPTWC